MKQFIEFTRKEFLQTFRDKRTMFIIIAMPLVMMLLFGFAITTEVKDTKLAILDYSKDTQTKAITEEFATNKYFTLAEYLHSPEQIDQVFKEGKINMVMVFGNNFAKNLTTGESSIQLLADGTEPNQASLRVNYANNILRSYAQNINQQNGTNTKFNIIPNIRMLYNPQSKSEYMFVPGVIGMMFLLLNAMMTSIAIVKEKEKGTMEMLLSSPLNPVIIIVSKAIPYLAISTFNLCVILIISHFILFIPIAGNLLTLILLCLLYIIASLALGLFISSIAGSQLAAMLMSSLILMVPTILLSGIIFPVESMPQWLQIFSYIVPAKWFVDAIRKIMIMGVSFQYVAIDFAVITFMVILFIGIAVKKFKIRLE